jgi:hypothetical protein
MKTPLLKLALGVLVAVAVATPILLPRAMAELRGGPVRDWRPEGSLLPATGPPGRPPGIYVSFTNAAGAPQRGVVVHYDWVIGGKPRTYQMRPPIAWPPTLHGLGPLLVEIAAEAPPHSLELRLYQQTAKTGIPRDRPITWTCHPGGPVAGPCAIKRHGDVWQAVVDGIPQGREYYVAASAMWFIPSTAGRQRSPARSSQVAAWLFHIETA